MVRWPARTATALTVALSAALCALASAPAWAVPSVAMIEGALTTQAGGPVADGDYFLTFAIYDADKAGTQLFAEGPLAVAVQGGHFSHQLGSKTPLTQAAINVATPWLQVQVGTDPALARKPLGSTLYAVRAGMAEGLDCSGCIQTSHLDASVLKAYAKTTDLAAYAKATDLGAYAKTSDLSAYAKASDLGAYAKTSDLGDYVKAAALAPVAASGAYADLAGTPNLAKVAISGSYNDLTNLPGNPTLGKSCGTGLWLKGFKADGSLDCSAIAPADLPADAIDEISNGLIWNQFTDSVAGTPNVAIPDGLGAGIADSLTFPDIGLAQKVWIQVDLTNTDISKLKIEAYSPGNPNAYILYDGGKTGTALSAKFNLDTAIVSGNLNGDWVGKNIKGIWSITVKDPYKNAGGGSDGAYNWSVAIQTLSNKKVLIKGNLIVQGSVQMADDTGACTSSNAGAIRWNGKAFQGCNGSAWIGLQGNDGSSQAAAGKDCKAIKNANNSAADGVYWIDPNGGTTSDAFQVFCDMTTDGGGWTFFGHVNNNYVGGTFFQSNIGTYRTDRADDNTSYSRAADILPLLSHTQMMVTLDNFDPVSAKVANKIVFYQYTVGHKGFNLGPVPCSDLGSGFSYRTALTGAFSTGGTTNSCDGGSWYTRTAGNAAYLVLFNNGAGYANYWGSGMGGNDSWYHDGWWYVR